jgi:hypothetical protein
VISALLVTERSITPLERGAPFLWVRDRGRHCNVVPLPESQAQIPVCSTVARPNPSAVDLHQPNHLHHD